MSRNWQWRWNSSEWRECDNVVFKYFIACTKSGWGLTQKCVLSVSLQLTCTTQSSSRACACQPIAASSIMSPICWPRDILSKTFCRLSSQTLQTTAPQSALDQVLSQRKHLQIKGRHPTPWHAPFICLPPFIFSLPVVCESACKNTAIPMVSDKCD